MDREKLTKAIVEYCEDFHNGTYKPTAFDISEAFKSGTDWLMQQPLSERLTDEEKEKIREIYFYNRPITNWVDVDKKVSTYVLQLLEAIFGADLFKEK